VLARHDPEDAETLKSAARTQAGYDKVKLEITMLGDSDLPAQQAGLVQAALARNPLALILEPADTEDKHLARAVAQAQDQGVPVLFLYRALSAAALGSHTSASGGATASKSADRASADHSSAKSQSADALNPPILIGAPSFGTSAKQLVESAIRNAKNGRLDPKRGAIVVINTVSDAFSNDRASALHEALKKAGINPIDEVRFAYTADRADKVLSERFKVNPKATMVFATDSLCLSTIRQLITQGEFADHHFVMAGYVSDDRLVPFSQHGDMAALAEFNATRLVRKAITAAAAVSEGKNVPEHTEIPVLIHDSPPGSGLPTDLGRGIGMPKRADGT
jgi:ABC-type sugar transport system substrate-binding protein